MSDRIQFKPALLNPLDSLFLLGGKDRPRKNEPHTPSGLHSRRWCHFHRKVCCMKHGKHKRGRVLHRKQKGGQPY